MKNNLDEYFKSQLEFHTRTPAQSAWKEVQKNLATKKRVKIYWRMAAALLIFLSTYLIATINSEIAPSAIVASEKQINEEVDITQSKAAELPVVEHLNRTDVTVKKITSTKAQVPYQEDSKLQQDTNIQAKVEESVVAKEATVETNSLKSGGSLTPIVVANQNLSSYRTPVTIKMHLISMNVVQKKTDLQKPKKEKKIKKFWENLLSYKNGSKEIPTFYAIGNSIIGKQRKQ